MWYDTNLVLSSGQGTWAGLRGSKQDGAIPLIRNLKGWRRMPEGYPPEPAWEPKSVCSVEIEGRSKVVMNYRCNMCRNDFGS